LLIFSTAAAAVVLPLRHALFMASLTTLAIIGESVLGGLARFSEVDNLLRAGLYGFTTFVIAILSHLMAYRIRDYRLIAEHQQRTLTRLEQINELIIRRMRSGVLAVDSQCNIKLINESAWFLLGSPPVSEQKLQEVSPELNSALSTWLGNPAGEMVPLTLAANQAQIVPKFVSLPGDREIRVLIFLEDNDVVAQRAIELSANSLAKLSGSIAHEIRNPLAAVSHAAQLLEEADGIPESEMRMVNIIYNQSRRMNGIVENILQLSRREKSRPEIFELTQWLDQFQEEFRSVHSGDEIELMSDFAHDDVLVLFDRSQLHQAVWKLMENATEHAGNEDEHAAVMLRMKRQPKTGYCVITVEDNGPGVPDDMLGQIFEPFFTTRKQGSGLGLYIARQLCEANQAELTVDSTLGQGTRFHIRLALARSDAERDTVNDH
jgi:two-component system sensor histidine kinase PilS (NtrC family)